MPELLNPPAIIYVGREFAWTPIWDGGDPLQGIGCHGDDGYFQISGIDGIQFDPSSGRIWGTYNDSPGEIGIRMEAIGTNSDCTEPTTDTYFANFIVLPRIDFSIEPCYDRFAHLPGYTVNFKLYVETFHGSESYQLAFESNQVCPPLPVGSDEDTTEVTFEYGRILDDVLSRGRDLDSIPEPGQGFVHKGIVRRYYIEAAGLNSLPGDDPVWSRTGLPRTILMGGGSVFDGPSYTKDWSVPRLLSSSQNRVAGQPMYATVWIPSSSTFTFLWKLDGETIASVPLVGPAGEGNVVSLRMPAVMESATSGQLELVCQEYPDALTVNYPMRNMAGRADYVIYRSPLGGWASASFTGESSGSIETTRSMAARSFDPSQPLRRAQETLPAMAKLQLTLESGYYENAAEAAYLSQALALARDVYWLDPASGKLRPATVTDKGALGPALRPGLSSFRLVLELQQPLVAARPLA